MTHSYFHMSSYSTIYTYFKDLPHFIEILKHFGGKFKEFQVNAEKLVVTVCSDLMKILEQATYLILIMR